MVTGDPRHLREVADGGLRRVRLPVGVGGEARGRVERERRLDGAELLRIEGQELLQPLDPVGDQHSEEAERQQRERIDGPGLLGIRLHAAQAIQPPLHSPYTPPSPRPKTRGSGCRSPSKTRNMYAPSGLVSASTTRKKRAICNHPLAVIRSAPA